MPVYNRFTVWFGLVWFGDNGAVQCICPCTGFGLAELGSDEYYSRHDPIYLHILANTRITLATTTNRFQIIQFEDFSKKNIP